MDAVMILIICLALYFLPSLIAGSRNHSNINAILALNFFLGWTVIGWVLSFIWALTNQEKPQYEATRPELPKNQSVAQAEQPEKQNRDPEMDTPLPIINLASDSDDDPGPVQVNLQEIKRPTEQDWVKQARSELAASRRK